MKNIKIEIWSDVACPFCYIGKRKFETALAQFEHRDSVAIEWKSFILDPNKITDTTMSIEASLVKRKGISIDEAKSMSSYAIEAAKKVDLHYNFDKTIVANTYKVHRFLHYSKSKNVQNQAKEIALQAYFTEGKNIDDTDTLIQLGTELGLDKNDLQVVLNSDQYLDNVKQDISEAQEIGVRGVPFFVFNRQYAVSGAQDSEIMLNTLEKAFSEMK